MFKKAKSVGAVPYVVYMLFIAIFSVGTYFFITTDFVIHLTAKHYAAILLVVIFVLVCLYGYFSGSFEKKSIRVH